MNTKEYLTTVFWPNADRGRLLALLEAAQFNSGGRSRKKGAKKLAKVRQEFNAGRNQGLWLLAPTCFACDTPKPTHRHHIIPLYTTGYNYAENIVSLCRGCHAKIHPWINLR